MYYVVTAIILAVSVLLVLLVLVQNSKGGGLAANFGGGQPVMGVRRTTDFLEKATWGFASALLLLSFVATMFIHTGSDVEQESAIKEQIENVGNPMGVPFEEGDQTDE
jgi:preprotein translocase subunit SecG